MVNTKRGWTNPLLVRISSLVASLPVLKRETVAWMRALAVRSTRESEVLKWPTIPPLLDVKDPRVIVMD